MADELKRTAGMPLLGSLMADAMGVWMAWLDASNMANLRADGREASLQEVAIEQALAARSRAGVAHDAVAHAHRADVRASDGLQAAA